MCHVVIWQVLTIEKYEFGMANNGIIITRSSLTIDQMLQHLNRGYTDSHRQCDDLSTSLSFLKNGKQAKSNGLIAESIGLTNIHVQLRPIGLVSLQYSSRKEERVHLYHMRSVYSTQVTKISNQSFHVQRKLFARPSNTFFTAVNILKTQFLLNNIYKFGLYLRGNTLRLHYKAQPVNAVWGNSRCLL
jgi:hypothetical protein